MRTAARKDDNQDEIIDALESAGAAVQSIHQMGRGCPNILAAHRGVWYVAEIKDGSKPPSKQKLTDDEERWHEKFSHYAPVHIWRTAEDALITIGVLPHPEQSAGLLEDAKDDGIR